jgi:dephospho-CoA kinase
MIIGLIGQKRVGKDTVASIIKEFDNEYKCMALADPIKDIARIMFNFSEKQLYDAEKDVIDTKWYIKPRDFFEQFGTDIMQFDIYKYLPTLESSVPQRKFWVLSLLSKLQENDKVIITDIRGQHELEEVIKFNPNAKFIRIIRPTVLSTTNDTTHITQSEPNQIEDTYITETIINDGSLDNLKEKVKNILKLF